MRTWSQESFDGNETFSRTLQDGIRRAAERIVASLCRGKTVFACGNGGSAGLAQQFASALLHRFETDRRPLPAVDLVSCSGVATAIANDASTETIFSRQLEAFARRGDVLLACTASGDSRNVLRAVETAHAKDMLCIAVTGKGGGTLARQLTDFDMELRVPARASADIRDAHQSLLLSLCRRIDEQVPEGPILAETVQPSWENLRRLTDGLRPLVFTNGVFDLLHRGHLQNLKAASEQGVCLVVGVNSDASVKTLCKGDDRPIQSTQDRMAILAEFPFVDYVTSFDEYTPESLIRTIAPDVLVKGGDYAPEQIAGYGFIRERGGKVLTLPFVHDCSTTNLIAKIRGGNTKASK